VRPNISNRGGLGGKFAPVLATLRTVDLRNSEGET
jgi:hypothetical protein